MGNVAKFGTIVLADANPLQLSAIPSGMDLQLVADSGNGGDILIASTSADTAAEATSYALDAGEGISFEELATSKGIWVKGAAGYKLKWAVRGL